MKKNTLIAASPFIFFFLFFSMYQAEAQIRMPFVNKLKVEILEVDLSPVDTSIKIIYDLIASRRRYYNTRLFYSNNGGNSFKGPLRALKGDFGDSTYAGHYKEVIWLFRRDNPYFDGKNIMFKIEVAEVPKISNGGPENALRSLLIPGFGDTKVRNGYNYGLITALTYSCLGTGALFHFISKKRYNDYQDRVPNTEGEHQDLFNRAKNAQNLSRGFLIAGAAIWLGDIVGVYVRGVQNRRRVAKEEEDKAEKESTSMLFPRIIPLSDGRNSQLTLLWKF